MAKVIIQTSVDLDDCVDRVEGMRERDDKFRPIFREMKEELQDYWKKNFLQNGSLVGGWAPLDKEYGAWKSVHFPGAPPMVRSGELFNSIANLRGPANEMRDESARFGTSVKYAKFHQYGTSKMPKREIIFEPRDFGDRWSKRILEYIIEGDADGSASS
jgi:phage gpG-like protein